MSGFDPFAYPALVDLGGRLRELAGDASYQAGRDYFRKGLVTQGAVGGTTAYATVTGSTNYRVSVGFAGDVKVTCTCPAHRRNRFCKHVVALSTALTEQPHTFAEVDAPPEPPTAPPKERKPRRSARPPAPDRAQLRASGLATVERLLGDLAADGLMSLGPEKVALLENAGELVRGMKLRRLGNRVLALQRAASGGSAQLDEQSFARLLIDLWIAYRASAAHLNGEVELDPLLAEDLIGKTWRAGELESIQQPIEAMELAYTAHDDGEFLIQSSYLADLETAEVYVDRQIAPMQRSSTKPRWRHRLQIDEAGLYPGLPPRRIHLASAQHLPLTAEDVDRLLSHAETSVAELRRRVAERGHVPFGAPPLTELFRPGAVLSKDGRMAAVDSDGQLLVLEWPAVSDASKDELLDLLPEAGFGLFGRVSVTAEGLAMRCLSIVSGHLRWPWGPVYPGG
jgi:hypothetical protein